MAELELKEVSYFYESGGKRIDILIKPAIHLRRVLFTRLLVLLDRGKQRR